jgi:hypothetical protein
MEIDWPTTLHVSCLKTNALLKPISMMKILIQFPRLRRLQLSIKEKRTGYFERQEEKVWMDAREEETRIKNQKNVISFFESYMKRYPYALLQELDFRFFRKVILNDYKIYAEWRVKLMRLYPTEDGAANYKTEIVRNYAS